MPPPAKRARFDSPVTPDLSDSTQLPLPYFSKPSLDSKEAPQRENDTDWVCAPNMSSDGEEDLMYDDDGFGQDEDMLGMCSALPCSA